MAQLDLYIDTYSRTLVSGPSNSAPFNFPGFTQGDTISLRIYLLARTATFPMVTPYAIINNAALTLRVGIGDKNGTAGTSPIAAQFTWAKDANNQYFYADLALNTAEVTAAIGVEADVQKWLEIEYAQGGNKTTVFQQLITLHADVLEEAATVPVPGETALTQEAADNRYPRQYGDVGVMQTFRSANGSWARIIGVDDDGNPVDEVIAI